MKLDASALRYLSKDELRVLTAVEMAMKNHEIAATALITSISGLRFGGTNKALRVLHRHKLLHHEQKGYDGYRLTTMGYDYLALSVLRNRGSVVSIGSRIGVGKEADVFMGENSDGRTVCLKVHRLGRTSFRAVKLKRDYHRHRSSASWIYLSRLAAVREFAFMQALFGHNFSVPEPLDSNRHVVVMGYVPGRLLNHVHDLADPQKTCDALIDVMTRLAEAGLVHCDLNEYNVLIGDATDEDEDAEPPTLLDSIDGVNATEYPQNGPRLGGTQLTVIDFPQMVSISHADAEMFFDRDVDGICKFFAHRFGLTASTPYLNFEDIQRKRTLDVQLEASGFSTQEEKHFEDELQIYRQRADRDGASVEDENVEGNDDADSEEFVESSDELVDTKSKSCGETVDESIAGGVRSARIGDFDRAEEQHADEEDTLSEIQCGANIIQPGMSATAVAQKVRKAREKRERKQVAKRNAAKSAEKRKSRNEVRSADLW